MGGLPHRLIFLAGQSWDRGLDHTKMAAGTGYVSHALHQSRFAKSSCPLLKAWRRHTSRAAAAADGTRCAAWAPSAFMRSPHVAPRGLDGHALMGVLAECTVASLVGRHPGIAFCARREGSVLAWNLAPEGVSPQANGVIDSGPGGDRLDVSSCVACRRWW